MINRLPISPSIRPSNRQSKNQRTNLPEQWLQFDNADQLAQYTLEQILKIASESIEKKGAFHFVTAGGTTPMQVYKLLAELEKTDSQSTDWAKWFIYMGDERCLPVDNHERNSLALQTCWLDNSLIPQDNIYYIPAELGAKKAAKAYQSVIEGIQFDVILLGMGEDGHTASLFPGHNHQHEANLLVQTEFNSPKPPAERVTLSSESLGNSRYLFKLITGAGKCSAVKGWLKGESLPISLVEGLQTSVLISEESLPTN